MGAVKTPEIVNALSAQMMSSANRAIKAGCDHRLRNRISEKMKAAAATIPKSGNAIGPYANANLFATGKSTSMPWKRAETDRGETQPAERDKKQRGGGPGSFANWDGNVAIHGDPGAGGPQKFFLCT